MLLRLCASGAVLASLMGCSSTTTDGPAYASCNDALPASIHAETTGGAPNQIELRAGTFYWIARSDPTSGAALSSTALAALTPGGAPKVVALLPTGIARFWVDASGFLLSDEDGALWRAPLDGGSPPEKLFTSTLVAAAWTKDATTLYGVNDQLLTTTTTTALTSTITIVAQPLDGTAPRTLATWTVPTGGIGETVLDDGDAVVGVAAGSIFRVGKGDGHVVTQPMGPASIAFGAPPRNGAFYVGLGGEPHLGTLALDGTLTELWPSDLPAFVPWAAGEASDGTAYFAGDASASSSTRRRALARVGPDGRASIVLCTPETSPDTTRVLVDDAAVYLVRGISNSEAWEIDRVPR